MGTGARSGVSVFGEEVVGTGTATMTTLVPLSQMLGYGQELNRRTHGHGTLTMAFSHYAPAIVSEDDGDRAADVMAPRRPRTPPLINRAAVPEPARLMTHAQRVVDCRGAPDQYEWTQELIRTPFLT